MAAPALQVGDLHFEPLVFHLEPLILQLQPLALQLQEIVLRLKVGFLLAKGRKDRSRRT